MKMALSEFVLREKGIYGILHVIYIDTVAIFSYQHLCRHVQGGSPFYEQSVYMKVQLWICALFLADFVLEWFLAEKKGHYVATHFIFLLVAIPYQNIIAYMGWTFSPEITYMLRFIPLVRGGYAMAIVVGWLTYNRASGLFVSYLTMLLATVYFSSLAFYVMEHGPNPLVKGYGDALWWAFMDVTTVGSNIIAVTPTGRVLSVLLAALGMMMFPIFTVYVTSLVERRNKEKRRVLQEKRHRSPRLKLMLPE